MFLRPICFLHYRSLPVAFCFLQICSLFCGLSNFVSTNPCERFFFDFNWEKFLVILGHNFDAGKMGASSKQSEQFAQIAVFWFMTWSVIWFTTAVLQLIFLAGLWLYKSKRTWSLAETVESLSSASCFTFSKSHPSIQINKPSLKLVTTQWSPECGWPW